MIENNTTEFKREYMDDITVRRFGWCNSWNGIHRDLS